MKNVSCLFIAILIFTGFTSCDKEDGPDVYPRPVYTSVTRLSTQVMQASSTDSVSKLFTRFSDYYNLSIVTEPHNAAYSGIVKSKTDSTEWNYYESYAYKPKEEFIGKDSVTLLITSPYKTRMSVVPPDIENHIHLNIDVVTAFSIEKEKDVYVTLNSGDLYSFYLSWEHEVLDAKITLSSEHGNSSLSSFGNENRTTYYDYYSKPDFKGKDYVEITCTSRIPYINTPSVEQKYRFHFDVQ